jgi:hypothetical protein
LCFTPPEKRTWIWQWILLTAIAYQQLPAMEQGFDVHITDAGQSILTMVDGKAMPVTVEEYRASTPSR